MQVLDGQNHDQASDLVEVRSKKKKKKLRGSKSPQGQQAASGMNQEHQEYVAPQRNAGFSSHYLRLDYQRAT